MDTDYKKALEGRTIKKAMQRGWYDWDLELLLDDDSILKIEDGLFVHDKSIGREQ